MCLTEHSFCWGPRCGAPASRSPPVGAERAGDVILNESVGVPAGSEPVQVRRREFALLPRQLPQLLPPQGREAQQLLKTRLQHSATVRAAPHLLKNSECASTVLSHPPTT